MFGEIRILGISVKDFETGDWVALGLVSSLGAGFAVLMGWSAWGSLKDRAADRDYEASIEAPLVAAIETALSSLDTTVAMPTEIRGKYVVVFDPLADSLEAHRLRYEYIGPFRTKERCTNRREYYESREHLSSTQRHCLRPGYAFGPQTLDRDTPTPSVGTIAFVQAERSGSRTYAIGTVTTTRSAPLVGRSTYTSRGSGSRRAQRFAYSVLLIDAADGTVYGRRDFNAPAWPDDVFYAPTSDVRKYDGPFVAESEPVYEWLDRAWRASNR